LAKRDLGPNPALIVAGCQILATSFHQRRERREKKAGRIVGSADESPGAKCCDSGGIRPAANP
jgi:hypothetical protein